QFVDRYGLFQEGARFGCETTRAGCQERRKGCVRARTRSIEIAIELFCTAQEGVRRVISGVTQLEDECALTALKIEHTVESACGALPLVMPAQVRASFQTRKLLLFHHIQFRASLQLCVACLQV